jgi:hypothetical protein
VFDAFSFRARFARFDDAIWIVHGEERRIVELCDEVAPIVEPMLGDLRGFARLAKKKVATRIEPPPSCRFKLIET